RACYQGLTAVSWWLWRSGVNTSLADDQGQLPLEAAISNKHWDTVLHLIQYTQANPFIASPYGKIPFLLIPQQLKENILQGMAMDEFILLDQLVVDTAKYPI
ncbi:unnamed protein product, partial [Meganyctiphanes norvegica]